MINRLTICCLLLLFGSLGYTDESTSAPQIAPTAPPAVIAEAVLKPTYVGKVIGISDGDTVKVLLDGEQKRIRLEGIDTPELGQPYGLIAKEFTAAFALGKEAKVIVAGTDRYRRDIAQVYVGGKSLNKALLRAGLAWHYKRYSTDQKLADIETAAKKAKQGLWADPIPPWEWRKRKTSSL